MSDIIEKLLLRNLQEVFGEGDPAHRRAAIEVLYTEDCTVLLPLGRYVGHQALDQVAGELRAGHPSFVYTPHSAPQAVQDAGRIAWGSGPAGEPPRYGARRHHRPRREDRRPLRLPRLAARMKWTPLEQLTQAGAAERHRGGWHGALDQLATSLGNAEVVR